MLVKIGGKPGFFGLDQRDDFPPKLLRKLFGEIEVDGLRDHVTAGWDGVIENGELLKAVENYVQPILRKSFEQQYRREIQLAQARLQKAALARLAALPDYKRQFAVLNRPLNLLQSIDRSGSVSAEHIGPNSAVDSTGRHCLLYCRQLNRFSGTLFVRLWFRRAEGPALGIFMHPVNNQCRR
jgi:hypothetical protein